MKKWQKTLFVILPVLFLLAAAAAAARLTAPGTEVLTVTGGQLTGRLEKGVYTFLGVPYADVKERFAEPGEAHWEGILSADEYGPVSPQQPFSEGQDNNCLNLNIWTCGLEDGRKRPVMVWLHGGSMVIGSANEAQTNGKNLAAGEDVVVVSVNHRLGVLAFLDLSACGENYVRSGNLGLLDIIAALRWIRSNIEVFGGDPDNITIFGQSGGGAKVLALMSTPYAQGLFQKAIVQSGATDTMGCTFASKEMSGRVAELTLQHLSVSEDNIEELQEIPLSALNDAGEAALRQAAEEFRIKSSIDGSWSLDWMPCVDGDVLPSDPVLETGFADCGHDIPLLIGSNLNEWHYSMGTGQQDENAVLSVLRFQYGTRAEEILKAFKTAYPDVGIDKAVLLDNMIRGPLMRVTAHKADQAGAPVYSYLMTYGAPRAVHGAEIPLVFDNASVKDRKMASVMRKIWGQFARTGDPAVEELPFWKPYTRENGAVMVLDRTSYLSPHHDEALLRLLWPGYLW